MPDSSTSKGPSPTRGRPRRQAPERRAVLLLLPIAMLLIVGLGAVLSASSVVLLRDGLNQHQIFQRQLIYVAIGVVALIVTSRIPYRLYNRWAALILGLSIVGLIVTLLIGDVRGGARSWIELGFFTMQPSEFAKFGVVVYLASVLTRKEQYLNRLGHVMIPVIVSLGVVSALLMMQPDLGTTMLIAGAAFAVLAASAAPMRHLALFAAMGVGAGVVTAVTAPYRWQRITAFLDPNPDRLNEGFQVFQSLVALGTGGIFGVGLGASRARWSFLPHAHTDFIFAIIGEETGLAGSLAVVALFVAFAVVGMVVASRAADRFGRLLAVGIVAWLSIQAIVNIGGVIKALPITGVPLPFISSGGSAMIVNLAAIGVLVNIARNGRGPGEEMAEA